MKQSEAIITASILNNQFFAAHIGAYVAYAEPLIANDLEYDVTIRKIDNEEAFFVYRFNDVEKAEHAYDVAWLIIHTVRIKKKAKDEA